MESLLLLLIRIVSIALQYTPEMTHDIMFKVWCIRYNKYMLWETIPGMYNSVENIFVEGRSYR